MDDVSVLYLPLAKQSLQKAIQATRGNWFTRLIHRGNKLSATRLIHRALLETSNAVNRWATFSGPVQLSLDWETGSRYVQYWVDVERHAAGYYELIVPNPNWIAGLFVVQATLANTSNDAWLVERVETAGRSLSDR